MSSDIENQATMKTKTTEVECKLDKSDYATPNQTIFGNLKHI